MMMEAVQDSQFHPEMKNALAEIKQALGEVKREVGHIQKDVSSLKVVTARTDEQVQFIRKNYEKVDTNVTDIHCTLFQRSNGKPSVVERLVTLEASGEADKERRKQLFTTKLAIAVALITGGTSLIVTLIAKFW